MAENIRRFVDSTEDDELLQLAILVGCAVYLVGNLVRQRRLANRRHLRAA